MMRTQHCRGTTLQTPPTQEADAEGLAGELQVTRTGLALMEREPESETDLQIMTDLTAKALRPLP